MSDSDSIEPKKPTVGDSESVVLVLQGRSAADHQGIVDGYERLRAQGVVRSLSVIPIFGEQGVERGDAFWKDVVRAAFDTSATSIVFQYYHSNVLPDPRPAIGELRRLPSSPMIAASLGDPFMNGYFGRPSVPRSFLQLASASHLVTLSSMGPLADHVARYTVAPIMLLPLGSCQVRFGGQGIDDDPPERDLDVVFVGSRNRARNPARGYYWLGLRRQRLVERLTQHFGRRFGVFGNGWDYLPSAKGPVPFAQQVRAVRRAKVVVGGIPFSNARYYCSDRPFIQASSGIPLLDFAVPGVDTLLRDGEHWLLADENALITRVEEVLSWSDDERQQFGRSASEFVRAKHTQAHRVSDLIENIRRIRVMKSQRVLTSPHLPFFLETIDPRIEESFATRNWSSAVDNLSHSN